MKKVNFALRNRKHRGPIPRGKFPIHAEKTSLDNGRPFAFEDRHAPDTLPSPEHIQWDVPG
jgi:hypothetical protein